MDTRNDVKESKKPLPPPPKLSLDEYYKEWERKARAMHEKAAGVDWSAFDWAKLKPQDVGVRMGPPMTAEQFQEYRARRRAAGAPEPRVVATSEK